MKITELLRTLVDQIVNEIEPKIYEIYSTEYTPKKIAETYSQFYIQGGKISDRELQKLQLQNLVEQIIKEIY